MAATLVLVNGRIMDPAHPKRVHSALAAFGGTIIATGTDAAMRALAGPLTRIVDLHGDAALPGFADTHCHLVGLARASLTVDLAGCASSDAVIRKLKRAANDVPPDDWLVGRGWNDSTWRRRACKADIDAALPGRKVMLKSYCGHSVWLSSAGLNAAGIDRRTLNPAGGLIERDADGELTGVLKENAAPLAFERLPKPTAKELCRGMKKALSAFRRAGITTVHSFDGLSETLSALVLAGTSDSHQLNVLVGVRPDDLDAIERMALPYRFGDLAKLGPVKVFIDGSLGARSAWVSSPYADGSDGLATIGAQTFSDIVRRANRLGFPVAAHAIGDRAVRLALDTYLRDGDRRILNRVEHASLIAAGDMPRFRKQNVAACVQPPFIAADREMIESYWGMDAVRRAYPIASLLRTGAIVTFGSDAPVEPPSAVAQLQGAVIRSGRDDRAEAVTVRQAIRCSTVIPAILSGDLFSGRTLPGYRADLTLFSDNPYLPGAALSPDFRVTGTVVAGKYSAGDRK